MRLILIRENRWLTFYEQPNKKVLNYYSNLITYKKVLLLKLN